MAMSLLLLLVALSPFSVLADVTWNIDCGSSDSSFLDNNLIIWSGDDTLISAGQSRTLKSTTVSNYRVIDSLRIFTSGKKNCYVLDGEKGAKLLVRASFFYGNYDGKSSPPKFGLELDGNEWAEVVTDMEVDTYVYYEVTYVSKGDSISVCLIQTNPNYYPFISALEVRTLDPKMYQYVGTDQALALYARIAFGADKTSDIGYGIDKHDRFWSPENLSGPEYTTLEGTISSYLIDTTTVPDNPPAEAVQNAMTTSDTSARSMKWALTDIPSSTPIPIYLTLYFTELTELDTTDKRSFSVYVDDKLVDSSQGLTPFYGNVTELTIYSLMASNSTTITLNSTADSTLPPIINAMEVFRVINYTVYSPAKKTGGSGTGGGGNSPSSTNESGLGTTTSSSRKKKSKVPVALGVTIPGVLLLVAFVVVMVSIHQKRQQAAMAAAAGGGAGYNGQGGGAAYNNNNNVNGQVMMAGVKLGQELTMMNGSDQQQQVNADQEQTNGQVDLINNPDLYASPAPLLNKQTH